MISNAAADVDDGRGAGGGGDHDVLDIDNVDDG